MIPILPNDLRCPVCLHEFNGKAMMKLGIKGCPVCKTVLQPLVMRQDGYIRVNWQDMRTLAIYAKRWSKIFDLRNKGDRDATAALKNIFIKLEKFRPVGAESLVPKRDPISDSLKRVEVSKGGAINIGDNITQDTFKRDQDGNIPSPFFSGLF